MCSGLVHAAEALLGCGRVLVIVDGLSERDEVTRSAFDPSRPAFPVMRLVVTSRDAARGNMGARQTSACNAAAPSRIAGCSILCEP